MNQNTNTKKMTEEDNISWPASDENQHTFFASEPAEAPEATALPDELAGINPEAMQEAMREAHHGLFGGNEQAAEPADMSVTVAEITLTEEPAAETPDAVDRDKEIMFGGASGSPQTTSDESETVTIPKSKFELIEKLLRNISENTQRVTELLNGGISEDEVRARIGRVLATNPQSEDDTVAGNIIEGVFNGQCMIGPDGKQYNMPSNYASKSKLVEGDILKLTITPSGKFIYKQIGPIERTRVVGTLIVGTNGEHYVEKDGSKWKILTASVTYFKGRHGDEAIILVPKHGESTWAAVENIVSSGL